MKLTDAGKWLDETLNVELAEDWDNVGWMVRGTDDDLTGITLAVDPSPEALKATIESNHNLLVSHHPLIFDSLDRVVEDVPVHDLIMQALQEDVGIYAAHTNVDSMVGGLSDYLANELDLNNTDPIHPHEDDKNAGFGRIGTLENGTNLADIEDQLEAILNPTTLETIGEPDTPIKTVGLCAGSGADFIGPDLAGTVDVYITADVKHHPAMEARHLGLPLIILDHYEMESVFNDVLETIIYNDFPIETQLQRFRRENPYRRIIQ